MVRHSVIETYDNDDHFDLVYIIFVWVSFKYNVLPRTCLAFIGTILCSTGSFRKSVKSKTVSMGILIFTNREFSQLFYVKSWRQIYPLEHPGLPQIVVIITTRYPQKLAPPMYFLAPVGCLSQIFAKKQLRKSNFYENQCPCKQFYF